MSCQSCSLNKNTGREWSLREACLCLCDPYLTGPVSYWKQSALTGPRDKLLYERGHLNLWNPSSAFCLAQLTNGFKQHSGSFRKVFPDVCLQREWEKETKREREREGRKRKNKIEERSKWDKWTKTKQRMRTTFPQLAPYFGKGPTVIPQRSCYLAGVCSMVSVFNPRW